MRYNFLSLALAGLCITALPSAGRAQDAIGHTTVYTHSNMEQLQQDQGLAHTNMPMVSPGTLPRSMLLRNNALPSGAARPKPGSSGSSSAGAASEALPQSATPQAFGNYSDLSIAPFTSARASADVLGTTLGASSVGVTSYPWRATGKLYFNESDGLRYVCSASMITRGLLITAAHCVYDFGKNSSAGWHTNYIFVPAQYAPGVPPPYGYFKVLQEHILAPYYNGSDTCAQKGASCNNDIAILAMGYDAKGRMPGQVVGWYTYGWNGYSYVPSFGGASLASITQLGYPVAFDQGLMMERTDGVGAYWYYFGLKNTLLGSALTGGSSGGPWLVNFGAAPKLTSDASLGNKYDRNVVVGVTSWGYIKIGSDTEGSSWFGQNTEYPNEHYKDSHGIDRGAGNIGALVAAACTAAFGHC